MFDEKSAWKWNDEQDGLNSLHNNVECFVENEANGDCVAQSPRHTPLDRSPSSSSSPGSNHPELSGSTSSTPPRK